MRYKYQSVARDGNGVVISSGTVSVYLAGTTTPASIYTSSTSTDIVNSVTTSSNGVFTFYIDAFDYGSFQRFKYTFSHPNWSNTFTEDNISVNEVITGNYTISTAKTFTYPVEIPYGVTFTQSATGSIAINSSFSAGDYQIFIDFGAGEVTGLKEVNPKWFGTLNTAITVISSNAASVKLNYAETLTANLTIPSTCELNIVKGGSIVKASTYTLTINGPLSAGLYQVFSGFSAGDVTFGVGSVKDVYPIWFVSDVSDAAAGITSTFSATPYGGTVRLTRMFTVKNNLPIVITKSVNVLGLGGAEGSGIYLDSTVGAGTDVININPETSSTDSVQFRDLTIVPNSGTPGRDVIRVTVDSTHLLRELIVDNCTLHADGAGYAINGVNTVGNLNVTGMFHNRIENSMLTGGIKFNKLGDSNIIRFNIISGNHIGVDITQLDQSDGGGAAAQTIIEDNNITAIGGAIKIVGAWLATIARNNMEQTVLLADGYMVHLENVGGRIISNANVAPNAGLLPGVINVLNNKISPLDPTSQANGILVKNSWGVHIHDNFIGSSWVSSTTGRTGIVVQGSMETRIENNDFYISSYCTGVSLDASTKNTYYFGNRKNTYSVNHTEVSDSGVGTMGIWKTGTINVAYASYSAGYNSFGYMKDSGGVVHLIGTIKPASGNTATINDVIFTFGSGFIPDKNMPYSATAALTAYNIYPIRVMGTGGGGTPGQLLMDLTVTDMTYFSLDGISFYAPLASY